MRTLLLSLCTLLSFSALAGPGGIRGTVTDEGGKPLPFALVRIGAAGDLTDRDGRFLIPALTPGEQSVNVVFSGYPMLSKTVLVLKDSVKDLGRIKLTKESAPSPEVAKATTATTRESGSAKSAGAADVEVRTTRYKKALIEPTSPGSRTVLTAGEIEKMPTRSPLDVAATAPGVYSGGSGSAGVRGSRGESTAYVVDGVVSHGFAVTGSSARPRPVRAGKRDKASAVPAGSGAAAGTASPATSVVEEAVLASSHDDDEASDSKSSSSATTTARAGSLTSGESNDFSKWTLWEDMVGPALQEHEATWKIYPQRRYSLSVRSATGAPVCGATVKLLEGSTLHWEAVTDNTGRAELWAGMTAAEAKVRRVRAEVAYAGRYFTLDDLRPFGGAPNLLRTSLACNAPSKLDVAFIVDATGSMGDEINYLKAELTDILQKVKDSLPKLDVQTAAVFYQDLSDRYVTDAQDFTPGIAQTVSFIGAHGAEGGGDTPEAVDMALDRMLSGLTWRDGTVAKIAFLVLDAPPHADPVTVARMQELTAKCAARGIRLVPVACSGVDKSTEYLMRALALATNGTYLFLTDHSGIGGSHTAPTTDRYDVEYLNGLVYRVIHQFSYLPECGSLARVTPDTAVVKQPIDSVASVRWKFYPNPTTGLLNVEYDRLAGEFFVCDISGKAIIRVPASGSGRTVVDLTQYPAGVYFLRYQYAPEKWLSGRFVVTH